MNEPSEPVGNQAGELAQAPFQTSLVELLHRMWGRLPSESEVNIWMQRLREGLSGRAFIALVTRTKSFQTYRFLPVKVPAGHYYSPVVDPDTIGDYHEASLRTRPEEIAGIVFPLDEMAEFWRRNEAFISATPFGDLSDSENRYGYRSGPYPYGDAIMLRAIIGHYRPRRIIEIGSGASSVCMLDSAEHAGLDDFQLTCIEPFPTRLRSLLRPGDERHVVIHERGVQGMPLGLFQELEANDILFIDSTHVLKTGSDVHYELFHILPTLKPGVLVHFHDCRYPFEYSRQLVFEKRYSWNEAYGVRALLMYSSRFRVVFYNSLFAQRYEDLIRSICPDFLKNPGSSLWIEVLRQTE
jgi:hypothetical protein